MNKIISLAHKEINSYFKTPIAYVVLVLSFCVFNFFFFLIIDQNREATLRDVFKVMEFMLLFFIPILTMRLFSEEKQTGTIEFLLTSPIRERTVVIGKFIGSVVFLLILLSAAVFYYLILTAFSNPDFTSFLSGMIGLWLEGLLFCSIGLYISSLTRHQIIAAIGTYIILLTLYLLLSFIQYTSGPVEEVVRFVSVLSHSENFHQGLFYLSDISYYVTGSIFFLLLTIKTLKAR